MMLDRQRLSAYVGSDASFEAQFLTLLRETVADCVRALDPPTLETYRALHAAKPGLMVATTQSLGLEISQICDALLETSAWPLQNALASRLDELRGQLRQLSLEIETVLADST
jgi:hypothetical protein